MLSAVLCVCGHRCSALPHGSRFGKWTQTTPSSNSRRLRPTHGLRWVNRYKSTVLLLLAQPPSTSIRQLDSIPFTSPVCTTQASPTAFHLVFFDTYFSTSWWKREHFSLDCLYVDVFFLSSVVVVSQVTLQSVPNPSELSLVQKR